MANRSNYYPRTLRLQSWEVQNGKVQGLLEVKNGLLDGTGVTYYPSGKVKSKENYKNGYEEGINTIYYENGNIEY